ncbi:MAG: hypothetical protein AAGJ81_14450 [Verrucomicrobiota bacterium]
MKKSELRMWAIRTHMPDEWWLEIDGSVSEEVITLDEAFRRGEGLDEAYIIHASHAEETEEPHWIKMGQEETLEEDQFGVPKWVCAKCKFSFDEPEHPKVSFSEVFGYVLIIPGAVLTARRLRSANDRCPRCGSKKLIKGASRAGQALMNS